MKLTIKVEGERASGKTRLIRVIEEAIAEAGYSSTYLNFSQSPFTHTEEAIFEVTRGEPVK